MTAGMDRLMCSLYACHKVRWNSLVLHDETVVSLLFLSATLVMTDLTYSLGDHYPFETCAQCTERTTRYRTSYFCKRLATDGGSRASTLKRMDGASYW